METRGLIYHSLQALSIAVRHVPGQPVDETAHCANGIRRVRDFCPSR